MTELSVVILIAIWIGMATVIGLSPRKFHPPGALLLLTFLVVLLPYIWIVGNLFLFLAFSAGVASVMRWPFYYIGRAILRGFGLRIVQDDVEKNL